MRMRTSFLTLLLIAAGLAAAGHTQAALTVSREVTVTDEAGGTLTLVTSATHEIMVSDSLTTATFADFRPNPDGRIVNGEVVRTRVRAGETVESRFDGSLQIAVPATGTGPDRLSTLQFEGLTVVRGDDGAELSGTVVYNGTAFDASELPPAIRAALRRVLRFFRFA